MFVLMFRGSNKPERAKFLYDVTRMTSVTNITSITAFADSGQPNLEAKVSLNIYLVECNLLGKVFFKADFRAL